MNAIELEKIIISLKKKYHTLFATTIGGELYIWRLLSRVEYDIICKSSAGDGMLKDEMICQTAVVYPEIDFTVYKAGIPTTLSPQIIEESGFGTVYKTYEYLHYTRQGILENFTAQAEIAIAAAFPQYTFEQMKHWGLEQLLDMVARAEWKLNVIDGKDFVFQTTEEETEELEKTNEELVAEEKQRIKELEQQIINQGGDPILALGNYYKSKAYKEYIEFPFIMGTNWDREDVINAIKQQ